MTEIYFWLFIGICLSLLLWGLVSPDRVYQYPFFMGGIFIAFIGPQAYTLVYGVNLVNEDALNKTLIMASLCAAMCYVGYRLKPSPRILRTLDINLNSMKLLRAGVLFIILGYLFRHLMLSVPEDDRGGSTWTGPITIYAFFFAGCISLALFIYLIEVLERPTYKNIILTGIAALPVFEAAFGEGRRTVAASLFVSVGLSLFFTKKYVPPRLFVLLVVPLALLLIPLVGIYRGKFWSAPTTIDAGEGVERIMGGESPLELRNAVLFIDFTTATDGYEYGIGYWNNLVFRFVPGQLVGADFKQTLKFETKDINNSILTAYGYDRPQGTTPTGIGDSFVQFGYLGSLFFAALGYLFRTLWSSVVDQHSTVGFFLYVSLLPGALLAVTHGTQNFPPDFIYSILFLSLLIMYSRKRQSRLITFKMRP